MEKAAKRVWKLLNRVLKSRSCVWDAGADGRGALDICGGQCGYCGGPPQINQCVGNTVILLICLYIVYLLYTNLGKVFARVVLNRLQVLAEHVYPEAQCGFRFQRSTIDMIFSLRQLQEKCREQRQPLYIAFIDLTKAFDLVSRKGLFTLLHRIGCPHKLLKMVTSFHDEMKGTVQYDGSSSEPFPIRSGVKQGCVLTPTLFGIFFSLLLRHATPSVSQNMVSSSALGVMATFSTLHVCAQRPRCAGSWLGRCCLLMMPLWLPILRKHYSVSSAASLVPLMSLGWPSAWRKQTSWARMSAALLASPSAITPSRWWRTLHILAPLSPATSLWTTSWTPGSARHQ